MTIWKVTMTLTKSGQEYVDWFEAETEQQAVEKHAKAAIKAGVKEPFTVTVKNSVIVKALSKPPV